MASVDELMQYIFEDKLQPPQFGEWLKSSRTFKAFVETYRSKMRSKLRTIQDGESLKDLWLEFEIAYLLVRDLRMSVEYEKYNASRGGGPDFATMFRKHIPLNVEVTRIRGSADSSIYKLMSVICNKSWQTQPASMNVVVIEGSYNQTELQQAAQQLRLMADQKQEAFFTKHGYKNAVEFLKYYRQLSAIVLRHTPENSLWLNPVANRPLSKELVGLFRTL